MSKFIDVVNKYDFRINKYEEKSNVKIIDTDNGKYVLKQSKDDNELYKYLDNKQFNYYLEHEKIDEYNVFPYVEEVNVPKEDKAIDLVYLLSILHNKTLFYRNVVIDDVKKQYENLNQEIDNINKFYFEKQDIIEQKIYMSPEEYLLIRNASLIYSSLTFAKEKLKEWYQYKIKQKKERIVLLHNKPSLDHLLINDKKILISWDNYKRDIPIYDFLYFYKNNYNKLEMISLFDIYNSKFSYTKDEYLLFLVFLAMPKKVEFTSHHFNNTVEVQHLVDYLNTTRDFILKYNKEDKTKDKEEFKE